MHRPILKAVLLALPALGVPALAQSRQCQSSCLQEARRSSSPDPVQACAIRCAAADAFLRQQRGRSPGPVRLPAPPPDGFGSILAAPVPSPGFGPAVRMEDRRAICRVVAVQCRAGSG
jgi:hypothetical protein